MDKLVKIEFIIGGLDIPRVGLTQTGVIADVDSQVAQSLCDQGIAKRVSKKMVRKAENKVDLVVPDEGTVTIDTEKED